MSGNRNKLIAFNYFGGKFTWLEYLYANFPRDFTHLVDLFAGSMAVSLNYPGRIIKTANEINGDITNFFEVLRDHEPELTRLLLLTPCSELEYNNSWEPSGDKIERARRFYVRIRQSFFGLGAQRKNKGWHCAKSHVNARGGETVSRWNNAIEKLHEVAEVIRGNFRSPIWTIRIALIGLISQTLSFTPTHPIRLSAGPLRMITSTSSLTISIVNFPIVCIRSKARP